MQLLEILVFFLIFCSAKSEFVQFDSEENEDVDYAYFDDYFKQADEPQDGETIIREIR